MSPKQESFYWRLWRSACIEQGWEQLSPAEKNEKRHAAHLQALGLDKSHKDFSNADCDKVYRVFKVLADPGSIGKQVDLLRHTESNQGERERFIWRIKRLADLPYIIAIMRDKFDTTEFETLNLAQLEMLRNTLVTRKQSRTRREKIDAVTGGQPVRQDAMDFPSGHQTVSYQMRPAKKFTPAPARETADNPY